MSSENETRMPEDFAPLDLSMLVERPDRAVNCRTEEEALHFLASMKCQHPDKCETWDWPETNYESYGEETVYCAGLHPNDFYSRMMYGTVSSFTADDYTVIPFSALAIEEEIAEGDQPLDFLFGGVADG